MRSRSPAKILASEPPAPGRSSIRHGRGAKGCWGVKTLVRPWPTFSRSAVVSSRSPTARERRSGSVLGSLRMLWISESWAAWKWYLCRALDMAASSAHRLAAFAS